MELSRGFLKAKNPCSAGYRWFVRRHPHGSDHQQTLDALVAAGRVRDASWLLSQFGPTNPVLRLDAFRGATRVLARARPAALLSGWWDAGAEGG